MKVETIEAIVGAVSTAFTATVVTCGRIAARLPPGKWQRFFAFIGAFSTSKDESGKQITAGADTPVPPEVCKHCGMSIAVRDEGDK